MVDEACRTVRLHLDRSPDLAAAAWFLEERGVGAESCEYGLRVTARVRVGVVFAHVGPVALTLTGLQEDLAT